MSKLDILNHVLKELERNECVLINVDKERFPRWQQEREKHVFKGNYKNQNVREILPNEIIIEFDEIGKNSLEDVRKESNKWIEKVRSWLIENNYSFYITDHKGKSPHIRLQIGGLENKPHDFRKKYKYNFVDHILESIKFSSEILMLDTSLLNTKNKLISLELQPHFKQKYGGNKEDIFYFSETIKVNKVIKEIYDSINNNINKNINLISSNIEKIDMKKLKNFFKEHYIEGNRNKLILALGGILRYNSYTLKDAKKILNEILIDIDPEGFEERYNEISYSFSENIEVSIRPWLYEIFSNLTEEEKEKNYEEFKSFFNNKLSESVITSSGKFTIKEKNNNLVFVFIENNTDIEYEKNINDLNTLNKFKRFLKDNEVEFNQDIKQILGDLHKLKNNYLNNKTENKNSVEGFFDNVELLENNQLIYDGKFSYTMCNGDKTLLVSFDDMKIISDSNEFNYISNVKSNLISSKGFEKLKKKQVNDNIFHDVKILLSEYLDYDEEDLIIKTLWVFHTYMFNIQGNTVYLHFTGRPGTGKSTAQKVLNHLCWNSEYCCNLSEAALFRELNLLQNTLHLDEVDKWNKEKIESIQGLLNNGYSKGGIVKRVTGSESEYRVEKFRVFSPKTLTTNKPKFLDSFKTRCIDIIPQRTSRNLKSIDVMSDEDKIRFIDIRDDIYIYMLKYGLEIFRIFKEDISNPKKTTNRENQLISVLNCFNKHFHIDVDLNRILKDKKDDFELSYDYYYFILKFLFESIKNGVCIITTREIADYLNKNMFEDPFYMSKVSNVKVGLYMKNLNLKKFKCQKNKNMDSHHYEIPEKVILEKIKSSGYEIE